MKNFKKVLALVLAVVMLLSFATVASAKIVTSDFYKDTDDIDYTEAVDVLGSIGVLNGFPDDTFRPDATITRAQAAKIIAMFDNGSSSINGLYASANPFTDCVDNWAESFIAYCAKVGIIAGVGGTKFAPDANVTGVQFLKMALVVLGYDAKVEGLEGKNWDVNTLALAKKAGLTRSLGVKFDYSADLKRQEAAVIMLDALRAQTVVYGSSVGVNYSTIKAAIDKWTAANNSVGLPDAFKGVNINGAFYMTVAGAVQTGEKLGKVWGLTEGYAEDAFYRPYSTWLLDGVEIGRYMFPVQAEYHTAYDMCQVLVDLGVAKNNTTSGRIIKQHYVNGAVAKIDLSDTAAYKHSFEYGDTTACVLKNNQHKGGAQGTLTQIFVVGYDADGNALYRICEIDTWLGKVTEAKRVSSNRDGHLTDYTHSTIAVIGHTDATKDEDHTSDDRNITEANLTPVTSTVDGLAKDDYVLVSISAKENCTGVGYYTELAKSATGSFDGYKIDSYPAQTRIDGTYVPDSLHFHLNYDDSKDRDNFSTKLFYYDRYDNVIGIDDPAAGVKDYLVIDRMWLVSNPDDGEPIVYMDVVSLDAKITKKVSLASFLAADRAGAYSWANVVKYPADFIKYFDGQASNAFAQSNTWYYNNLDVYAINSDGEYVIVEVNGDYYENVSIVKGNPVVNADGSKVFGTDAETKYLIHEKDGTYTAVTGFRNVDSLTGAHAQIVAGTDNVADIVYIWGDVTREGDNVVAYVTGPATDWVESYNGVDWNKMTVYIDGVATDLYVDLDPDDDGVVNYFDNATWAATDAGFYTFHYETVGSRTYVTVVDDATTLADMAALNGVYTVEGVSGDVLYVTKPDGTKTYYAIAEDVAVYSVRVADTVVKEKVADYMDKYGFDKVKLVFNAAGEVAEVYSLENYNY